MGFHSKPKVGSVKMRFLLEQVVLTFSKTSELEALDRGYVGAYGSFANLRVKHSSDLGFIVVVIRAHVQFHKHIFAIFPLKRQSESRLGRPKARKQHKNKIYGQRHWDA